MLETLVLGVGYRMLSATAHASTTVLCGLLVATVFRTLVGGESLRRLLGAGSKTSLVRAWLTGMLLPVCSIGAIPVARELRRVGLSAGAVLAFAVSAPLFNPISLLYGLTLSHPLVIVGFAAASMAVVSVVGIVQDRAWQMAEAAAPEDPRTPPGWRRLVVMLLTAVREAAGPTLGYAAIAVLGVGLLSAALPAGILQQTMKAFDPWAPPMMAAVGLPSYLTPTDAMMQIGGMFDHGNSVGAAYVLLSIGAGLNLGLAAWAFRAWGWKQGLGWMGVLLAAVLAVAFLIERPLSFRDSPPEDHTHAFDSFCMPFPIDTAKPAERVLALLADRVPSHEWTALGLLGAMIAAGLVVRRLDPTRSWEMQLAAAPDEPEHQPNRRYDVVVPGPVLGGVFVGGLVAASVVAAYLYYPAPQTCLEDLQFTEAEVHAAALDGARRRSEVWIVTLEDLIRRTEVGLWIRGFAVDAETSAAGERFREAIEAVEHEVLEHDEIDPEHVRAELKTVTTAGREYRDLIRKQVSSSSGPRPKE